MDIHDLSRLAQPGVLGNFESWEVTTLTQTQRATGQTFNLLTLVAAQAHRGVHPPTPRFMGKPIPIPGLHDLGFGIAQHEVALDDLPTALHAATVSREWINQGKSLLFSELAFRGHWFAPADGGGADIALNQMLKNNFWNGSHVWEWVDTGKEPFRALLETPAHLQKLSAAISDRLPIRIAGLSDKLGGLFVQIPVQVVEVNFRGRGDQGGAEWDLEWMPGVPERPVVIGLEAAYDGLHAGMNAHFDHARRGTLLAPDGPGPQFATVTDARTGDILGRYSLSFLRSIHLNLAVNFPEKRVFTIPGGGGAPTEVEISSTQSSRIGRADSLRHFSDTSNRLYRAEMSQLRKRRELVQYTPATSGRASARAEALNDIRELIRIHGRHAAWLWDPFLAAEDVLNTLLFNPHSESHMRALSGARVVVAADRAEARKKTVMERLRSLWPWSGKEPNEGKTRSGETSKFVAREAAVLRQHAENAAGLHLEFRARSDAAGWPFHDRFLIFPQTEGATLAWSLGTSVNSLGTQHHILQKVPDGRLIAEAFEALWAELDQPRHLVWRSR